ncbi:RNA chaperone ProQ, partial [Bienertia sinuspersici]
LMILTSNRPNSTCLFATIPWIGKGVPPRPPKTIHRLLHDVKHNGVTQDYIQLCLFKVSLGLEEFARFWDQVIKTFLARFYPLSKTVEISSNILNLKDQKDESLYDAWEHFKALLRACPRHNMGNWLQLHSFYNGLSKQNKITLDVGVGGPIMLKDPTTSHQTIESVVQNGECWSISERATSSKKGGMLETAPKILDGGIKDRTNGKGKAKGVRINLLKVNIIHKDSLGIPRTIP